SDVGDWGKPSRRLISPLVGEMSGRTEGGAVPPAFQHEGKAPSPLHLPRRHASAGGGVLAVFQLNALLQQFVADPVGFGPVLLTDEGEAFADPLLDGRGVEGSSRVVLHGSELGGGPVGFTAGKQAEHGRAR